jgi:hypothetical protein
MPIFRPTEYCKQSFTFPSYFFENCFSNSVILLPKEIGALCSFDDLLFALDFAFFGCSFAGFSFDFSLQTHKIWIKNFAHGPLTTKVAYLVT